jgi:hypothetical protein
MSQAASFLISSAAKALSFLQPSQVGTVIVGRKIATEPTCLRKLLRANIFQSFLEQRRTTQVNGIDAWTAQVSAAFGSLNTTPAY